MSNPTVTTSSMALLHLCRSYAAAGDGEPSTASGADIAADAGSGTSDASNPAAEVRRLEQAGVLERCQLLQGYAQDAPTGGFDAAVSLLVAHFIQREARPAFYSAIHDRLRSGGRFASAEICGDLGGPEFPGMLSDWKRVQALTGATPESLAKLEGMMRDALAILSPAETEALWKSAGFAMPIPFFQAFMTRGWHATKA